MYCSSRFGFQGCRSRRGVTTLQIDAFARRLGGCRNLDGVLAELLLSVESPSRFIACAGQHAADEAAPALQPFHELGEGQQVLLRPVEESRALHDLPKTASCAMLPELSTTLASSANSRRSQSLPSARAGRPGTKRLRRWRRIWMFISRPAAIATAAQWGTRRPTWSSKTLNPIK